MPIAIKIVDIADVDNYEKKDWSSDGLLIFSDEWQHRKHQCQNFIKSLNGVHDHKIHGRSCQVREIQAQLAKDFLEAEHIQGPNQLGVVYFGLFHSQELVGVMSLGRHSRQISENRIVLDRFCIKSGIHVQGGASKLFSRCVEWGKRMKYDEIISFSDNRWTSGKIYETLGFSLEKEYKPDYCYVDTTSPTSRLSKQSQKKSSAKCPEGMTEFEWAELRGLKKLWDRGKKRWVYSLDPSKTSWKEGLSKRCAEQHQSGAFKHSHIRGYFKSIKNNAEIYYGSSFELRCLYLLEQDSDVVKFGRAETFKNTQNGWRNPDLFVEFADGSKEVREVKPIERVNEPEIKKQINETKLYAAKNDLKFKLWTEDDSMLSGEKAIIHWAKHYIAETTGNTEWIERQKTNDKKKAKKHYDNVIAVDKVTVYCKYCKKIHTPLRLTHDKNIERNGRYICEAEGGFIAGSKPKNKKINPYAADGKKQCTKCNKVKVFREFGFDKSRSDGYSSRCLKCRAEIATAKYQQRKHL